jgi:hypothetical protein
VALTGEPVADYPNASIRRTIMAYRKRQGSGVSPATRITQEIIARLEAGTKPWIKPWRGVPVSRPLRACGIPYRGMNVFWLWMVADMCGYASPFWMTYNQAKSLGAQVRKGEKSTIAIFYKSYTKEVEAPDTGEKTDEARRVLKAYPVFNADQVEGLPERFHPAATLELVEPEGREAELDAFFAAIPVNLRHQGCEAYYTTADPSQCRQRAYSLVSTTRRTRRIMPPDYAAWRRGVLNFCDFRAASAYSTLEALRLRHAARTSRSCVASCTSSLMIFCVISSRCEVRAPLSSSNSGHSVIRTKLAGARTITV